MSCYSGASSSQAICEVIKVRAIGGRSQLIEANSQYAHIRYPDGREETVALQHLAPRPSDAKSNDEVKPAYSQSQPQSDNQDSSKPNPMTPHLPSPQIDENDSVAENECPSSSSRPISPYSSSKPELKPPALK